ncbi:MAG: transcription termination factor Rho [Lachnospiraceae bacterium]|nr:transcription termination factor Rho [Lachnospiraceae bacterium]
MLMDYDKMSLAELKAYAKDHNIKGVSLMRKEELRDYLAGMEKNNAEAEEKKEKPVKRIMLPTEERKEVNPGSRIVNDQKREERKGSLIRNDGTSRPEKEYLRRPTPDRNKPGFERKPQMGERPQQPLQRRIMPERPADQNQTPNTQPKFTPQERPVQREQIRSEQNENNEQKDGVKYDSGSFLSPEQQAELDSGIEKNGILEIMPDGFGFIRCDNYLPGDNDVYVAPTQIKRYGLRSGDIIRGNTKVRTATEKFSALLYIKSINGYTIEETLKRKKFENLTPVFPYERIHLETAKSTVAARMVDLIAPIGKGQRGMIVSQPKSGKTTLLKEIANSITTNHPDMNLIILLIDERPEEVTDIKESIHGNKVEVIYSTFDELPENHKRVSEMVIDRAKRLVEYGNDVVILLDSITRLARAYNLTCVSSGRTLSGGLDPAALYMPKKFFGAARKMREGGSLTILATALVETGSRMDDVVFEEFKGTGNMELVLDRNLSERRIFPAVDLQKSGTRRDDLLLTPAEAEAMNIIRKALNGAHPEDATEKLINMCAHTRNNQEFVNTVIKNL